MKNKKGLVIATIIVLMLCIILFGCSSESEKQNIKTITDLLGREVEVPSDPQRIVCIGAGALRLYSYIGDMNKLCGVENVEKTDSIYGKNLSLRAYKELNQDLIDSLPDCGKGGPANQSAEAEAILACNPDLIISLYTSDAAAMNELQTQTNTPVVVLSYGKTTAFDKNVEDSLTLLGEILNKQDRATELVNYIKGLQNDLSTRTSSIEESTKKSVYLGCNSFYGKHGFLSTSGNNSIFNLINIKNAAVGITTESNYTMDLEKLVSIDPDIVVLDAGGLAIMKTEYSESSTAKVYNSLTALKNGEVYLIMPYNAYFTNIEVAYINAYYIAQVVYSDNFKDINFKEKADEIFNKFLGSNFYEKVANSFYGGCQKVNMGEMFENYSK